MTIRRLIKNEALAYVRSGLYAARGLTRRSQPSSSGGALGVLFVHGVGANRTQFGALEAALSGAADNVDHFEYTSFTPFETTLGLLAERLDRPCSERVVVIGHSLGGLLLRMLLQREAVAPCIGGFVAICSPLRGTNRAVLGFSRDLRGIGPSSPAILALEATRDRLQRWNGSILTVGSTRDHFVSPASSAFLEEFETLQLDDAGHVGALFDERVHAAIRALLGRVRVELSSGA